MTRILLLLAILVSLPAMGLGLRLEYAVDISGSDAVLSSETFTICGDRLRIDTVGGGYILIDRSEQTAWMVDPTRASAIRFPVARNQAFFNQFLVPFGIVTESGSLLFPDMIFKRTGVRETINGMAAEQCRLPGQFLNSSVTAWVPLSQQEVSGDQVAELFSFFAAAPKLLAQMRNLKGFPVKIQTTVNLNGLKSTIIKTLKSVQQPDCSQLRMTLEDGITIELASPTGVPLADE